MFEEENQLAKEVEWGGSNSQTETVRETQEKNPTAVCDGI